MKYFYGKYVGYSLNDIFFIPKGNPQIYKIRLPFIDIKEHELVPTFCYTFRLDYLNYLQKDLHVYIGKIGQKQYSSAQRILIDEYKLKISPMIEDKFGVNI